MLEYALRQERAHKSSKTGRHHRVNSDIAGGFIPEEFSSKVSSMIIKDQDPQKTIKTQFMHKASNSNE